MVASNYYDLGTIIYLDEIGEVKVADRGGNEFDNYNRLDVFVPRLEGETDKEYYNRVQKMGRVKKKGYVILR